MDWTYAPPTEPWLEILFEDDALLVLNKPSELLSVPGRAAEHKDSLASRVWAAYPEAKVVHRLDLPTSGLMVMAKNLAAERVMMQRFRERAVIKLYQAIVWGQPNQDQGLVDLPLICDWPNRPKQIVDHQTGKPSQTRWTVLEKLDQSCRFALEPITGRTHQLRVHMAAIGHPIVGDRFYAHEKAQSLSPRLLLHARYLSFLHPDGNQTLEFTSEPEF